jgi:hypothetical protein
MTQKPTPAEAAAAEMAYMRAKYPEWGTFNARMRLEAHARYIAAQNKIEGPSPLQALERELANKYGSDFRTKMTGLDRVRLAQLLDARPNASTEGLSARERDWKELAKLKAGGATDTPNVKIERLGRIQALEQKLAEKTP